jgi:hypothetical protein
MPAFSVAEMAGGSRLRVSDLKHCSHPSVRRCGGAVACESACAAPPGRRLQCCKREVPRAVLKVENDLITEEIGLDDGVTALRQLGLIAKA